MNSLSERIARLPPEKRKLLTQLLEEKSPQYRALTIIPPGVASTDVDAGKPDVENLALVPSESGSPDGVKAGHRRFYDAVTRQLDSTVFGQFSFFLNYGYVPDHNQQHATITLPAHYINRNSVRLVLELIGD